MSYKLLSYQSSGAARAGVLVADTVYDGADAAALERRRRDVAALCERFPVPGL